MDRLWIILIGGLVPAFAFGTAAIFQKGAALLGVGVGTFVVYTGIVSITAGLIMRAVFAEDGWSMGAMPFSLLAGLCFAIGTAAFTFAVQRLGAPVSLIAPVTVISTLVTVVLGFIIFREHEGVRALQLLGGALFVVLGAALVATS